MESSNGELNRATSAPVKHEHETTTTTTSPRLKTFSSEKVPSCHSSPTKSSPDPAETPVAVSAALPTEAPVAQEMERSPSAYRIPAHVFERSPSSSPMEWSTASNESLFSIHTGNMSFTNDQFYLWRSGELTPPVEASTSADLPPPKSGELPTLVEASASTSDQMFSFGGVAAADMRTHEMGLAEATMLEVIKESENQNPTKPFNEVRKARRSEGSNTSNKSFAFSIMGAETTGSSTRLHGSIKSSHQEQEQAQAEAEAETETGTPAGGNQAQASWFSCFSCCSARKT